MKVLMVCLGNICRSPMAQAILEKKVDEEGLSWKVDSAGTGSWHVGEPPDKRAVEAARNKGIDISHQRARQIEPADLDVFDLVLAMDNQVFEDVIRLGRTEDEKLKVKLIMEYPFPEERMEVPDPYFEGGFDRVFYMLEKACDSVIEKHTNN